MTTQVSDTNLGGSEIVAQAKWAQRLVWFALLLIFGVTVLFLGSNFFDIFPTNKNPTYNALVSAVFLVAALWLKREKRWNAYWQIAYAFFVASMVYLVSSLLIDGDKTVLSWFRATADSTKGTAINKVYEVILMVIPILVLTRLSGADLGSVYLKRGNLKWGLSVGALVWFNFATSALLFFATRFTSLNSLGAAVVWGLVFSFTNGFMEELWLRGIFLKRFQPVLGLGGSVLLTSILFAILHAGATYLTPVVLPIMVANTFTLGLACGYLMMKTDSIWGPVLIHAAADLFLFIAMLSNA